MRKLIAILMALVIMLSLAAPALATDGAADNADATAVAPLDANDIVILYTNDVHTYIDNPLSYDVIAAIKSDIMTQTPNVLLVDAGDHIQGTAFGSMDKGKTIIDLMNAAGYDLATLGNHEFDYGQDGRINVTDTWAQFPYVSCNFHTIADGNRGENVLDSYKIFTLGAERIAIVGITTPESITKSTPAYFQDDAGNYIYGIGGGEDGSELYNDVQAAIDQAKAAGATKVIALGHLGDDVSSAPWTSKETIANISGLTAFIDGHSHSTVEYATVADKAGNDVVLTQTGEYFNSIGIMVIDGATGEITTDLISYEEITEEVEGEDEPQVVGYKLVSDLYAPSAEWLVDADVTAIKDAWISEIETQLGTVVGTTTVTFDNYDIAGNRIVRKGETNSGDFAADALYWLFDSMDYDVDIAIMNGGGVRNGKITGDITYMTCKEIHTFGNVACLQTITGQQLLDALEWGAKDIGYGENGGFLQVAGITYRIDRSVVPSSQQDENGVWTGAPVGKYRVTDVMVYNKETNEYEPLDLEASYNLAGYNYTLRDLGDGFAMFDGAVNVIDYVMEDYMVLATYIQAFEGGSVEATNSPLLAKYPGMVLDYSKAKGQRIESFGDVASRSEKPEATYPTAPDTSDEELAKSKVNLTITFIIIGIISAALIVFIIIKMKKIKNEK